MGPPKLTKPVLQAATGFGGGRVAQMHPAVIQEMRENAPLEQLETGRAKLEAAGMSVGHRNPEKA